MYLVINKKRCMLLCVPVLVIGLVVGGIIGMIPDENTFGYTSGESLTVVVDAGHGGPDGGAVGISGIVEADINFEIAEKLCEVLNGKGIDVVMTRRDRGGIVREGESWTKKDDMYLRKQAVKKSGADLFVSVHMNHFQQTSVHGLRLFYSANHPEIKPLAELMQKKMSEVTGAKISSVGAADKGLFLMSSPPMPAILAECGFLSNPAEEKRLSDREYQAKLAWAVAESIEEYFTKDK